MEGHDQGGVDVPEEILEPRRTKDYVVKIPREFLSFLYLEGEVVWSPGRPKGLMVTEVNSAGILTVKQCG